MSHIGFITGLAAESRSLRRGAKAHDAAIEPKVACAGAKPVQARAQAERLISQGAGMLVSFGVAGGLDPALAAGTLLLPDNVEPGTGTPLSADPDLLGRLVEAARASNMDPIRGSLFGSNTVVASVAEKAKLYASSGAAAVDMESHVVAAVATEAGLPFVVIRTVVDGADSALPSSVRGAVTPDGRSRGGLVAARLCLKPWEMPAVRQLKAQMDQALATLERFTTAAAPALFGRF